MIEHKFNCPKYRLTLLREQILLIEVKDFETIEKDDVVNIRKWVIENSNEKVLFDLLKFGTGSSISKEAREYSTSEDVENISSGSAVLVKSFAQQLIFDFFIKVNKPKRPAKAFINYDDAIEWLLKIKSSI